MAPRASQGTKRIPTHETRVPPEVSASKSASYFLNPPNTASDFLSPSASAGALPGSSLPASSRAIENHIASGAMAAPSVTAACVSIQKGLETRKVMVDTGPARVGKQQLSDDAPAGLLASLSATIGSTKSMSPSPDNLVIEPPHAVGDPRLKPIIDAHSPIISSVQAPLGYGGTACDDFPDGISRSRQSFDHHGLLKSITINHPLLQSVPSIVVVLPLERNSVEPQPLSTKDHPGHTTPCLVSDG